ncbi:diaminobutyrate acetyltransferase [Emcibacter sp. SYSU 3D8]|uniref:diaminobutyrate acetyltransferase n=1 Tax=Emcibacter sp. SYSU 3D8 TaxID=3133969 RepID=UPI0031FF3CB3
MLTEDDERNTTFRRNVTSEEDRITTPILFRSPQSADGPAVSALIERCPPLDTNSTYCNLLQCTHFADTCVLAQADGEIVGWISAYRPPSAPEQIFVWQVAVDARARGIGLASRMLSELIKRPAVRNATMLTTTITEANDASWALFGAFASRIGAPVNKCPLFEKDTHFAGLHDTEFLVSIGPFEPPATAAKELS